MRDRKVIKYKFRLKINIYLKNIYLEKNSKKINIRIYKAKLETKLEFHSRQIRIDKAADCNSLMCKSQKYTV